MSIQVTSRSVISARGAPSYADPEASSSLSRSFAQLHFLKDRLNSLERWELVHYREKGFLAWIARLILLLFPSSKVRLDKIKHVELAIVPYSYKKSEGPGPSSPDFAKAITRPVSSLPHLQVDIVPTALASVTLEKKAVLPEISSALQKGAFLPNLFTLQSDVATVALSSFTFKKTVALKKEAALAAVSKNGKALKSEYASYKSDKDVVLAAVLQEGRALRHAGYKLKADEKVVLAAVSQAGYALKHAHPALRLNKKIALAAVQQDGRAFKWIGANLRRDADIMQAAFAHDKKAPIKEV